MMKRFLHSLAIAGALVAPTVAKAQTVVATQDDLKTVLVTFSGWNMIADQVRWIWQSPLPCNGNKIVNIQVSIRSNPDGNGRTQLQHLMRLNRISGATKEFGGGFRVESFSDGTGYIVLDRGKQGDTLFQQTGAAYPYQFTNASGTIKLECIK